ncbi:thiamine phosphate synthase, partial [Enterococcus hirae]
LAAGAPLVQVRVKGRADRDVLAMVRDVVARVRDHGAPGLVNDRGDLALAAAADGVHLGAEDLPVADARRLADRWEQA